MLSSAGKINYYLRLLKPLREIFFISDESRLIYQNLNCILI